MIDVLVAKSGDTVLKLEGNLDGVARQAFLVAIDAYDRTVTQIKNALAERAAQAAAEQAEAVERQALDEAFDEVWPVGQAVVEGQQDEPDGA